MVADFFGIFLQELGQLIKMPNLYPDDNNSCLIKFKGDILVQLEASRVGENLIIGTDFGVIPPGRYRESIFLEALKANGLPLPRYGTFAYSKQLDHLILFEAIPIKILNAQKVADFLPPFLEKIRMWKEAISRGDVPITTSSSRASSGMFGLK